MKASQIDDPGSGDGAMDDFVATQPATHEDAPDADSDAAIAAHLEQTQDFAGLVEHLLSRLERAASAAARTTLLARVARLFEVALRDPERAYVTLCSALTEAPTEAVLADLDRLAAGLGRREELLSQAGAAALDVDDGAAHAALLWTTVARWARNLGLLEQAADAAERAHAADPDFLPALSEREEALRALQRWGELARVLMTRTRLPSMGRGASGPGGEDPAAHALFLDLAALWEDRIGDDEQALLACEAALRLQPHDPAALARLRRLAEKQGRTAMLADVLERSVAAAGSAIERSDLLARLAATWEQLERPDQACQALELLIESDPGNDTAHEHLARIHRQRESWKHLSAALLRHGQAAADQARRQALVFEAAEVTLTLLRRPDEAAALFERILTDAPGHVETLRALAHIHRGREQWQTLSELLIRLAENTSDLEEKKAALLEAASIHEKRLDDRTGGAQLYSSVSELDPDDTGAVERLFESAARQGDHARVIALGDWLLARDLPAPVQASLCERMVVAARAVGDGDRALLCCERAGALGADSTDLLATWAELAVERQQWSRAGELYRVLLARDQIGGTQRLGFALGLGRTSLAMNATGPAVRAFDHALTLDPENVDAFEGLAKAHAARGNHDAAIEARTRLFRLSADERKRIDLARENVRVYRDVLGQPDRALAALLDTLAALPDSHELSHDLLDLHTANKNWAAALSILERMAGRAKGAVRAKYLVAAGNILCYENRDVTAAIERFNDALDANPGDLKVFEKIDTLLTREQDWKEQERNYRRMLKRLEQQGAGPATQSAEIALWQGLGEIYRSRIPDLDAAAVAFEVVKKLNSADKNSSQILAELYENSGPQNTSRAIEENRELLTRASSAPEMAQHLRALQRLYSRLGDFERAYSATAALVVFHEATPDDREYVRQYTSPVYQPPQAVLTDDFWRRFLYHRDVDMRLSAIFAAVGRSVALAHAKTAKEWRVNPRSQHADGRVAAFERIGAQFVGHLANVLAVVAPAVTARPDLAADLDLVPLGGGDKVEPVLVLGAPMLGPRPEKDYAFVIGRALARTRPEHLMLWPNIMPSLSELRAILFAVVRLGGGIDVPGDLVTLTDGYVRHFQQTMTPRELENLVALGASLGPAGFDLPRWIRGVLFSTNRAAFLACNDLESATRLLQTESVSTVSVGRFEQIQDLVWWSVSEEFATFRRQCAAAAAGQ